MNIEAENTGSDAEMIQGFIDKGNFHAAFNIALSALNECRRNDDQPGVDKFLLVISGIVTTMTKEFGSSNIKV